MLMHGKTCLIPIFTSISLHVLVTDTHASFISSSEPFGSQDELIVYPCSVCPPFSKIFFSETACPIKAKFHV